jgi:hypothetical protein
MSFDGPAANTSGWSIGPRARGTGSIGCAERIQHSLPIGRMPWQRPNIGSRMNREVHVRFWERPRVKLPRATRQTLPKWLVRATSAFPSKATVQRTSRTGSFVPKAEITQLPSRVSDWRATSIRVTLPNEDALSVIGSISVAKSTRIQSPPLAIGFRAGFLSKGIVWVDLGNSGVVSDSTVEVTFVQVDGRTDTIPPHVIRADLDCSAGVGHGELRCFSGDFPATASRKIAMNRVSVA